MIFACLFNSKIFLFFKHVLVKFFGTISQDVVEENDKLNLEHINI